MQFVLGLVVGGIFGSGAIWLLLSAKMQAVRERTKNDLVADRASMLEQLRGKEQRLEEIKQEMAERDRTLHNTHSAHNHTAFPIPDDDPRGIFSPVTLSGSGKLQDIKVYIQAEHEFLSDVSFTLLSPKGQKILIQGRTLGRQTRLQRTYSFVSTPALRRLLQTEVKGRWQLQVIDHVPGSVGRLKRWELIVGV